MDLTHEPLLLKQSQVALSSLIAKAVPDLHDVNEVAAQIARTQAGRLASTLSKSKQRRLQIVISRALDQGWSDTRTQDAIAQVVGLDARYAAAVEKYRAGLQDGGMSPGKAKQAAASYAKRLLRHRAATIARSEIQQALNEAQRRLWEQQQKDQDLSRYAVRVWQVHKDERRCVMCRPMNGRRASLQHGGGYNVPGVGWVTGPPLHPNCRCFEKVVDQGISKAAEVEALPIVKHLRGLHDQKTHGHRGPGLQKSGFRPDIEAWLIRQQDTAGQPTASFAKTLLRLGTEYPEVAKNVRGVELRRGAMDGDSPTAIASVEYTPHGFVIRMDPVRMDEGIQVGYRKVVLSSERPYGTPEMSDNKRLQDYAQDYIEGVAVHEWGHAAHWHFEAAMMKTGERYVGVVGDSSDAWHVRSSMQDPFHVPDVKPLTQYATHNTAEMMAEWFAGYYFDILPDGFTPQGFIDQFEQALTMPVTLTGGVVKAAQREDLCSGHDHEDTVAATVAALGIKSRRGVAVISKGRLDRSPKENWVEAAGGLPKYIERIAHALHTERGMPISRAIAVAINRVKMWAAGGENVDADTRAKAAKAVAEWQALKAKNKAKG